MSNRISKYFEESPWWFRKTMLIIWVIFWVSIALIICEIICRAFIDIPVKEGVRPLQPYFMNGNVFDYNDLSNKTMFKREGPQAYGYKETAGIYMFDYRNSVNSIEERGNFLFQDKVELANNPDMKDTIRIFVVGGSAAWGCGSKDKSKRYYSLLEKKLSRALNKDVKIIPAAMTSYNSTQERLVLDFMVLPRKPDALIIFDGYNELQPISVGSRPGDPYNMGTLYKKFYSPFFNYKIRFASYFHLYKYWITLQIYFALEKKRKELLDNPEMLERIMNNLISVYFDNISHMAEDCRLRNIPCVAFVQPCRAITLSHQNKAGNLNSEDRLTIVFYKKLHDKIPAFQEKLPFYDLSSVFDNKSTDDIYLDPVHFNKIGHKMIADKMFPAVLNMLRDNDTSSH